MNQRLTVKATLLPPTAEELMPGSFFMRRINGWTGRWVSAAQAFIRGGSNYTHAGVILDNGELIEAEPGGAKIKNVSTLYDFEKSFGPILVSDAPMQRWLDSRLFPPVLGAREMAEWAKRSEIVVKARYAKCVQYSVLDYLAIAMAEFKLPGWEMVRDRVEDSQHMICSALVDRVYCWADVILFDDNRLAGDVTPWDLEQYVLRYEADRIKRLAENA